MKLIESYYEILTQITGNELKELEKAARTCYKSEDYITDDGKSAEKLISTLIKNGHEAMLEHKSLSVKFVCDRAISHELVRHRIASFAQESQRYCNYSKSKFNAEITFIVPWWLHEEDKGYSDWKNACQHAEDAYFDLLNEGWTPEQARGVLPNATKTEIVVTANYREWRHILKLRTDIAAHVDMRYIMTLLAMELKEKIPIVFDDISVHPPFSIWKELRVK